MEQIKENDPLDTIIQKSDRFDQLQYLILVCIKLYMISKDDEKATVEFLKKATDKLFFDSDEITNLIKEGTKTVYDSQFFTSDKLPGGKLFADCRKVLQPLFEKPDTVKAVEEFTKPVITKPVVTKPVGIEKIGTKRPLVQNQS